MGAVKQFYHDAICEGQEQDGPDEYSYHCSVELKRNEAEYWRLITSMPPVHDRTPEQQAEVDAALSAKLKAAMAMREAML